MAAIKWDAYGHAKSHSEYGIFRRAENTEILADGTIYERYDTLETAVPIYKTSVTEDNDGNKTIVRGIAIGLWANRASLVYVPVNALIEV